LQFITKPIYEVIIRLQTARRACGKASIENRDRVVLWFFTQKTGEIEHKMFKDIMEYFHENAVMNDTKVFLHAFTGNKKTGARIEVFLLRGIKSYYKVVGRSCRSCEKN
jgi:S-adenosylmethionine:tRNA-ribosyltransferase-isomerase (queuine synthetase)